MEIACQACGGHFNLPDEKVPPNTVISVPCPKCREKIVVDTRSKAPREPDFVPDTSESTLLCLVGPEERTKTIASAVERLGLRPVLARSLQEVISNLTYNRFVLTLLDESFAVEDNKNPALIYIQNMPMALRRTMVVGLISGQIATFDTIRAFALSADFIINNKDLPNLVGAAKRALLEHKQLYKIYWECQQDAGL